MLFGLKLVLCFPFFGVVGCVFIFVRALQTGQIKAGGGGAQIRTITRRDHPIQFWIQIVLIVLVAGFLTLFGLALFNTGPRWVHDAMFSGVRRRSGR